MVLALAIKKHYSRGMPYLPAYDDVDWDQMSYSQIADKVGESEEAVRRYALARGKVAKGEDNTGLGDLPIENPEELKATPKASKK